MRGRSARWLGGRAAVFVLVAATATGAPVGQPAWAAAGDITTVAGGAGSGAALSVGQGPVAVAVAGSHVWLMDQRYQTSQFVLRVIDTNTGQESAPILALDDFGGFHPNNPVLATDAAGDLFFAGIDPTLGNAVEELLPSGQVKILGGGGTLPEHVDHVPATTELLGTINGLVVDRNGNVYLSENDWADGRFTTTVTDSRIRKVATNGTITTVAGTGQPGFAGDGKKAILAKLNAPAGLATDPSGNVYIADTINNRIRKLTTTTGILTTVAGGGTSTSDNVPATTALVSSNSIAYDSSGLLVEDEHACRIRRVNNGRIVTIAGTGACGYSGDGAAASAAAIYPAGLASGNGRIAFIQASYGISAFDGAPVLRSIDGSGVIQHLAGSGSHVYGGDGGPALQAQFDERPRTAVDAAGNIYVTDDVRVRKIDPSGTITTFAGSGVFPAQHDTGDGGPATQATFRSVHDVAVGPNGDVYITDLNDARIRRVDPSGTITTVAGDGTPGGTGDGGPATQAEIGGLSDLAVDAAGNLFFGDGCDLRRVDAQGIISTVAGNHTCGVSGDGGPATAAQFDGIGDVATDAAGDVYVVDTDFSQQSQPQRVRRVDTSGIVTTVAGGGTSTADGVPATQASVRAGAIAIDNQGNLLIVDTAAGLVRRVGTDGIIRTIAGGGAGGDGGPATAALVLDPSGIAVDPAGNIFLACTDTRTPYGGGAIRVVTGG